MELSRLSNPPGQLVADTSAIINLIATECPAEILRALPVRVVMTDIAVEEIEDGRKKGRGDADVLAKLKKDGLIEIRGLGNTAENLFEQLVVGAAESTLDDGEAATIAFAIENSLSVVIDDYKARRICRERFSCLPVQCSVEIFRHTAVQETLGGKQLELSVLNALRTARMCVPPEHIEWVVSLIGDMNASSCPSLPFKYREAAATRSKLATKTRTGSQGSR